MVLLGPLAGILGDRFDRRLVMVVSDLVRIGAMLALVAVARYGLPVALVPALAAVATAAASPYPSCVAASLPRLLPRDELPAVNAVRAAIGPLAVVVGPMLGAALLAVGDAGWAFGANAATFGASALLVLAVPDRTAFRPSAGAAPEPGLWAAVTIGARELLRQRAACRLVGADILCSLCYGVLTVALVAVSARLGWPESGYGVLLAAVGAGGLLGTAIAPRAMRRLGRRSALSLALLVVAGSLPLMALLSAPAVVLLAALASGAGSLLVEVGAETALQEQLPDDVFARAYGFAFPASIAGIALGAVIAAPLIGLLGVTGGLSAVGALVAAYAAWLRTAGHADVRSAAPTGPIGADACR
jgi:MFS family permease